MMLICNKCGIEKEQIEFTKDSRKPSGYSKICYACTRKRQIEWENRDKEKTFLKRKAYRERRGEELKQKKREDYAKLDKSIEKAKRHKYYEEHKEEFLKMCKEYRQEHVEWKKAYDKEYAEKNKDKIKAYKARYRLEHLDHYNETSRIRSKEYRKNPQYRMAINLRRRIIRALKNNKRQDGFIDLLGCTLQEAYVWLESQFTEGMSWDNWGKTKIGNRCWQIDHKRPLVSFDLSDLAQQKSVFHYTNLQPLWWWDNLEKGGKWGLTKT